MKELLGVELPIVQAPMAGVQDAQLALQVSYAGGLGSLPCAMLDADTLLKQLEHIASKTSKPINLNFFCHNLPKPDAQRISLWEKELKPYFDELGITTSQLAEGPQRMPFSHQIADVIEAFKPPVISFHFGLPDRDLLQRVKAWGSKVLSSATTVDEALFLQANGADGIIVQGVEAGGHRGMFLSEDLATQIPTLDLLQEVITQVSLPVIAAGGIATSEDIQFALDAGATAVQLGTAYLLCDETNTSQLHRSAIKDSSNTTEVTNVFSGRPARGILNRAIKELGPINDNAPEFPLAATAMSILRSHAEGEDSSDFSPLWCGNDTSGCKEISAYQLTKELCSGLREPLKTGGQ